VERVTLKRITPRRWTFALNVRALEFFEITVASKWWSVAPGATGAPVAAKAASVTTVLATGQVHR